MTYYPQGKEIEYSELLERISIKMDSGIDFNTAYEQANKEINNELNF